MLRRVLIVLAVLVVLAGFVVLRWVRRSPPPLGAARIIADGAVLWDSTGEVRRQLGHLAYATPVVVLREYHEMAQVRTPDGTVGWVAQESLLSESLWQQEQTLAQRMGHAPVQAHGHTRVRANLRLQPGRDAPRLAQLAPNTPVDILARAVVQWSVPTESPPAVHSLHKEDWLLVRAPQPPVGTLTGWVVGRFLDLDLPDPLPEYAAAAGMRPVAFFPLHGVQDPQLGWKPYFLVAGTRGPEGQICDFTMLRVYTWSQAHQRYETAYVEDGFCGLLPIAVQVEGPRQSAFQFAVGDSAGSVLARYRMQETIVRRVQPRRAGGARHRVSRETTRQDVEVGAR